MSELLPTRAVYRPGEAVQIELRGSPPDGPARVWHLGELVAEFDARGSLLSLPDLPPGGYGVTLGTLSTAVLVTDAPRLRYGFVASYTPDKNIAGVLDMVRRLHLDAIQFYDWAWRHANLMGGGEAYSDALDQPISLATVRALVAGVQSVGSRALGYAAVYGVGKAEWEGWKHDALLRADGTPWSLGDFLSVVDPAAPDWLAHFTTDLRRARDGLGFDGFHLDQYGWPKRAMRADGADIDVAASFVTLIEAVRNELPDACLVFNNVNDFPTRATAAAPQDAVYVEPWAPQVTLQSLADAATRARAHGGGKPVVLAAYQHVYETAPAEIADSATAFTMATLFSHGATQLLAGEADRLLSDPYYVRNRVVEPGTAALLKRWYDFLVAHDELLMPAGLTEVTQAYVGAYNGDLDVSFGDLATTETAVAGAIWRRVVRVGNDLVVHLINLADQADTLWDAPRAAVTSRSGTLRVRPLLGRTARVWAADPDGEGRMIEVPVAFQGGSAVAVLPAFSHWQMLRVALG